MFGDDRKYTAKKLRLAKKVRRYQSVNEFILNKYGSFDQLQANRKYYVKEKSSSLKQSYNDYKTYMRNLNFVSKHLNEVIQVDSENEKGQRNDNDGDKSMLNIPQSIEGFSHNGAGNGAPDENTMRLEQNIENETMNNVEENTGDGITLLRDVDDGESNGPIVMNKI